MNKLLSPKNDVVFQKLFGVKQHEKILISFLNSILEPSGNDRIKSLTFEEKTLDVSLIASEKLSILDIRVITESNANINVEIQLISQYNMIKRTFYYMSKMLLKQLVKGDNYKDLNKTITINIVDFNCIDNESFKSCFHFYEDTTKKILSDILEIHFIELPKFNETEKDYCDKLHKWLTFLINPEGKEMDLLKKEDNEIKEAMDILYQISGDKELVQLAEIRDKAIRDENDRLEGSREEGRKEGIKKEKIDTVLRLDSLGLSIEQIAKGVELTNEQVKDILDKKSN